MHFVKYPHLGPTQITPPPSDHKLPWLICRLKRNWLFVVGLGILALILLFSLWGHAEALR